MLVPAVTNPGIFFVSSPHGVLLSFRTLILSQEKAKKPQSRQSSTCKTLLPNLPASHMSHLRHDSVCCLHLLLPRPVPFLSVRCYPSFSVPISFPSISHGPSLPDLT